MSLQDRSPHFYGLRTSGRNRFMKTSEFMRDYEKAR